VLIADCALEFYPAKPPPLHYEITFMNGGGHLPADEEGLVPFFIVVWFEMLAVGSVLCIQAVNQVPALTCMRMSTHARRVRTHVRTHARHTHLACRDRPSTRTLSPWVVCHEAPVSLTVRPVCALLSLSKPHLCAKRERSGKLQPRACASRTLALQHQVKQRGTLHLIVFILGLAYACQHQSIATEMLHMLVYVEGGLLVQRLSIRSGPRSTFLCD
jgi:hypothetical protein